LSETPFTPLCNGEALPLAAIADLSLAEFRAASSRACAAACAWPACAPTRSSTSTPCWPTTRATALAGRTRLDQPRTAALTPDAPRPTCSSGKWPSSSASGRGPSLVQAVRFHASWAEGRDAWHRTWAHPARGHRFLPGQGRGGARGGRGPGARGVIEPGHFRFQCHGETVFHLEIALGYQHRASSGPGRRPPPAEPEARRDRLRDSTVAHTWAYCRNLEALAGAEVRPGRNGCRSVALELERAANHTGDLGAMAGDVGFLPTSSFCRPDPRRLADMTAEACGSRLGRDWLRPGGLRMDLDSTRARTLAERLERTWDDTRDAVELLWGAALGAEPVRGRGRRGCPSGPGESGWWGVRGPGLRHRPRCAPGPPFGPYAQHPVNLSLAAAGNVHSRAWVRWLELGRATASCARP